MNKTYTPPEDERRGDIYRRLFLLLGKNRESWQSVVAAVGLLGGLLSIALGALDWAAVGLFTPRGALGSFLDTAGTVLFVLPLPLMAVGAHCFDLLEKKAPAPALPAARGRPDASAATKNHAHTKLNPDLVRGNATFHPPRGRERAADDPQRADDGRARAR